MPAVDDDFWLTFAQNGIKNSIENRDKAALRLDTFLNWLWSIYTSIFVLASIFNFLSDNIWQLILVSQPIVIIILARFLCTIVSIPSKVEANPNEVKVIIEGYEKIVGKRSRRLKIALIAAMISMVSLGTAIIGYHLTDPNQEIKSEIRDLKLKKEQYELQMQTILDSEKLECLEQNDLVRLDSLSKIKIQ